MPILPVRQKRALHRAADLGRDAERLRRRVGDEDRLDVLAVGEPQQELGRAVGRASRCRTTAGVPTGMRRQSCARSSRPRSVIAAKSVTPRLWIHWKIWRAWKRGMPDGVERLLELGELELGEVDGDGRSCMASSARPLRQGESSLYYAGPARPVRPAARPCRTDCRVASHVSPCKSLSVQSRNALRDQARCSRRRTSRRMVVREVLDNGLRLITETMPHVRSVTHRRVADARLAPRDRRAQRHRPLRRAHALQGHGHAQRRRHRAGDRLDRRPARRVHREGIRQLLHQGARRAPAARGRPPLRHRAATRRSPPTTSSARRR